MGVKIKIGILVDMNENYKSSIDKWERIKNDIVNNVHHTNYDNVPTYWLNNVWYSCGFCLEFLASCDDKCPLAKKHCHTMTFTVMLGIINTMTQIRDLLFNGRDKEAIVMIEYFIRCMKKYRTKFVGES